MGEHDVVPLPARPRPDDERPEGPPAIVLEFPQGGGSGGKPPPSDRGKPPKLAV
jgi:hypothetical protein